MNLPQVSVVIPARNASAWLRDTLDSVAAQTYPHHLLDVVLVDDGSTDTTHADAVARLKKTDISHAVVRNDTPQGPSAARNRGWRLSQGTWIQFLDADDLLEPEKIAWQAEVASRVPATVALLFSPWGRLVERQGAWTKGSAVDPRVNGDSVRDILEPGNFISTHSYIMRRSWLERVNGYDEAHGIIEDVDLLLRVAMAGGVLDQVPSDHPLCWYREHAASLSRGDQTAFVDGCVRNVRMVERHWRERHQLTEERTRALAEHYFAAARYFAPRDETRFDDLAERIHALWPEFLPSRPMALRQLTRMVGYKRAEALSARYRSLKAGVLRPLARLTAGRS